MVSIVDTRNTTVDGREGTIFTIKVIALTSKSAKGRAKGAMIGRFPSSAMDISVENIEEVESDIPGTKAHNVDVFVPHSS